MKTEKEKKACEMCIGYGWWAFGNLVPIGPIDYTDFGKSIKCPWCGAGDVGDGERFESLKKFREASRAPSDIKRRLKGGKNGRK
jgi:hypothetical protein